MHKISVLEPETEVRPFETCSFLWGNRNYLLRQPVQILSARQEGLWVFECPAYGLSAFSRSREEALSQLQEEFAFLYDGLTDEREEALTLDAITLRDKLRADVKQMPQGHGLETRRRNEGLKTPRSARRPADVRKAVREHFFSSEGRLT